MEEYSEDKITKQDQIDKQGCIEEALHIFSRQIHQENNEIINEKSNIIQSQEMTLDRIFTEDALDLDKDENLEWKNISDNLFCLSNGDNGSLFTSKIEKQYLDATPSEKSIFAAIGNKMNYFKKTLSLCTVNEMPLPVGAVGYAKVVCSPKFPENKFFSNGRVFNVRLMHNNLSYQDDCNLDSRVASIKFADSDTESPLDLILHTGETPPYYNLKTLENFVEVFKKGPIPLKSWCLEKPINYHGRVETTRKYPKSYTDQRYHSHVTYILKGSDKQLHLARIRILPIDRCQETGRLESSSQETVWLTKKRNNSVNSSNYLRKEFTDKLNIASILYILQIQTIPFKENSITMENLDTRLEFNAAEKWKEVPFYDLCIMSLMLPLSQSTLLKTKFNLLNHPECLSFPSEGASSNYSSLITGLKDFTGIIAGTNSSDLSNSPIKTIGYIKIMVEVTTGKKANSGTDGDVYITITGTKGRSQPTYLNHALQDNFEPGRTDVFNINIPDIGDPICVLVELRSMLPGRQWFLEKITVEKSVPLALKYVYPCYAWLATDRPSILLRDINAVLPQHEKSAYTYLLRRHEIEQRRLQYKWNSNTVTNGNMNSKTDESSSSDGESEEGLNMSNLLPGRMKVKGYDNLPKEAKFNVQRELDVISSTLRTKANIGAGAMLTLFDNWNPLTDSIKLLTNALTNKDTVLKIANNWRNDEEFGRQILNGVNPTRIKCIKSIPENMALKCEVLDHISQDRSISFNDAMQDNHVYILEYPELVGLEQKINYKDKYDMFICSPICILYSTRTSNLIPVAIQLDPGTKKQVFTSADNKYDWLLAKMFVRSADSQVHQAKNRQLQIHLVSEVFAMSTLRNLSSVHPLYKLLFPHLRYCIAVNVIGRRILHGSDDGLLQKLYSTGNQQNKIVNKCFSEFDFCELNVPKDLKSRGVTESKTLPGYYYRDDALDLWNILLKFARVSLTLHYWTDSDVKADKELQDWTEDIYNNGFHNNETFPSSISTLEDLVEIATTVLFNTSCRNAAHTNGMMDIYGFVPNAPTMLLVPPPNVKGKVCEATIQTALPNKGKSSEILEACYILSKSGKDQVEIGEFQEMQFNSLPMKAVVTAFQEDLQRLERQIIFRNSTLSNPYTYLLPSRISKTMPM